MASRPKLTQRRRRQALEAAVEVIAEQGLGRTRVADIARRAGLSPALLLYYFRSKDELLTQALTFAEDSFYLEIWNELTEIEDPGVRLVRLITRACPASRSPEELGQWKLWIELWARALHNTEATRKRSALDVRWRSTIADIIRSGQRSGQFAPGVNAEDFAVYLAALMDGLALQVALGDPIVAPEVMRGLCLEAATRELAFDMPHDDASLTAAK
jgi:AcrR family transcriptional regulator